MDAVNNKGLMLKFSSEGIQRDREVVMAAIKHSGRALHFTS